MTKKSDAEKAEKIVKVKLATGLTHDGKKHVVGEIVGVGESLAKRLEDRKQAVPVSRDVARQKKKKEAQAAEAATVEPQKPAEPTKATPDPKDPAASGDNGNGTAPAE